MAARTILVSSIECGVSGVTSGCPGARKSSVGEGTESSSQQPDSTSALLLEYTVSVYTVLSRCHQGKQPATTAERLREFNTAPHTAVSVAASDTWKSL